MASPPPPPWPRPAFVTLAPPRGGASITATVAAGRTPLYCGWQPRGRLPRVAARPAAGTPRRAAAPSPIVASAAGAAAATPAPGGAGGPPPTSSSPSPLSAAAAAASAAAAVGTPEAAAAAATYPVARPPVRTAVLVSGGGRSLVNLQQRLDDGRLSGLTIVLVISSRASAGALQHASAAGIPTAVVSPRDFRDAADPVAAHSDAVSAALDAAGVGLIVLAGWLHFYAIPDRYAGRVLNVHPSLIPAFCGRGYYGAHVHEAVVAFGVKVTGCTVHLCDNEYDHGPIIVQRPVAVAAGMDAAAVAAAVFEEEKEALADAVGLYAAGRLALGGRVVRVLADGEHPAAGEVLVGGTPVVGGGDGGGD
ncbi:hypothetical protein MMPV_001068 [Pyropia vietnamensis]